MTIKIPFFGNELRIKYRRPLRWVEEKRQVPVLILGSLVIAYWPKAVIEREDGMQHPS